MALLWSLTLSGVACGSDPTTPPITATDSQQGDTTALEIMGGDVGVTPDTTTSDSGSYADTTTVVDSADQDLYDSGWADDLGSGLPFDVAEEDVPLLPLKVISTTPKIDDVIQDAHAAFSVQFSQAIYDQSVEDYTVLVNGPNGQTIPGNFQIQGAKVSFKSTAPMDPASRVNVTITIQVQDLKGQTLDEAYSFHFHTAGFAKMEPYAQLALRYAPEIRQGLGNVAPANDLLRSIDYDGDWDATNNEANMTKFDAKAAVGWAVAETQSHFFIHYVYTWPRRAKSKTQVAYDNDSAGATVVVRRYPTEQPVALETWFKRGADERKWLFVTSSSGLVPAGKKPSQVNVRAVLPLDTLFPKAKDSYGCGQSTPCTPRRYPAYLTGGDHQSCLWTDLGDKQAAVCATDAFNKGQMSLIRYRPALKATPADAKGAKPGTTLPTYDYVLTPLFETYFARRTSPKIFVKPMTFTYKAPAGRPTGQKLAIGSKMLGGSSDFGRPPWAWRWKPSNNSSYYDLPRGTVFFDPAFALWQRIGGLTAGLKPYEAKTKSGMSLAYCFAPFLFVDQRDSAACKDSLPTP